MSKYKIPCALRRLKCDTRFRWTVVFIIEYSIVRQDFYVYHRWLTVWSSLFTILRRTRQTNQVEAYSQPKCYFALCWICQDWKIRPWETGLFRNVLVMNWQSVEQLTARTINTFNLEILFQEFTLISQEIWTLEEINKKLHHALQLTMLPQTLPVRTYINASKEEYGCYSA